MIQLLTFLFFLVLIAVVAWHAVMLVRDPTARTWQRFLFVGVVGGVLLAMLFIGVFT